MVFTFHIYIAVTGSDVEEEEDEERWYRYRSGARDQHFEDSDVEGEEDEEHWSATGGQGGDDERREELFLLLEI